MKVWICAVALLGCDETKPAPPPRPQPVVETPSFATAFSHAVRYDTEKKAILVDVKIAPGFHAYTVGETVGKPMLVALDEGAAYRHAGDVVYPAGVEKTLPIGKSVIVEGSAQIVAPIEKRDGAEGPAAGTFRYQVCTDESCDRPRTAPFSVAPPAP